MGWLSADNVARKRAQVPDLTWRTEFELQEPSPESRAFDPSVLAAMFQEDLGEAPGDENIDVIFETKESGAIYSTGTDWAKDLNWTVITTSRVDVHPTRVVAWARWGRMPWPLIVQKHEARCRAYPGVGVHDQTGVGKVVADYMTVPSIGIELVGKVRTDLFSNYILAVEHGAIVSPVVGYMRQEHKFLTNDKLFGQGHPPDSVVSGAMMWEGVRQLRGGPAVEETVEEGFLP